MPFARTATPTPAALAKRVRRLAAELRMLAHRMPSGWMLRDAFDGFLRMHLTTDEALDILERRKAEGRH